MVALTTAAVTIRYNTWSAGGSDASGYASQAELWLAGHLTTPLPLASGAPWPEKEWTFAPLGYRPAPVRSAMVPTYPPGLPMSLALVQSVFGRTAIHVLVPVLAGITVWLAFSLGRRLTSADGGLLAAVGLATSPIFLRQSTQLMADVPAAAWWTGALALAYRGTGLAAIGSGVLTSMAILTRPNLAPAAAAIFALVVSRVRRPERDAGTPRGDQLTAWGMAARWLLGVVPGCVAVAAINAALYGSPLRSGYGSLEDLYGLQNVIPNLHRYTSWLAATESPLLALAVLAGVIPRRRTTTTADARGLESSFSEPIWPVIAFAALIVSAYLPYVVFDDWWYIRFLIPGLPAAFVLAAVAVSRIATWLGPRWRGLMVAATTLVAGWSSMRSVQSLDSLSLAANEHRYAAIAAALPTATRTMAFAVQHSGSLRYYTTQPTLRWDYLPPDGLETAFTYVRTHGYQPLIVLDAGEETQFKTRFAASPVGALDWPPLIELRTPTIVRVYDPAQRPVFMAGGRIHTRVVFPQRR